MKALVGAFNQEKALVGAFSVIVQPVVEPMDRFTALLRKLSVLHIVLNGRTIEQGPESRGMQGGARCSALVQRHLSQQSVSWLCVESGDHYI